MFGSKKALLALVAKQDERLERLEQGLRAFAEQASKQPASEGPIGTLLEGFGKAFASMAESQAAQNKTVSDLTTDLLEKAGKAAHKAILREASAAGSDKSVAVRAERKKLLAQLPEWVSKCEECLALLQSRQPRHDNHMLRHESEHHREQLAAFGQLALPLNGMAN